MSAYTPAAAGRGTFAHEDASVLFSDISGFTALTESLARLGREGTEWTITNLSAVLEPLLDEVLRRDGDVIGFGGDALLSMFTGPGHVQRARDAARGMREALKQVGGLTTPTGRRVRLRMSQGLATGPITLYDAGGEHLRAMVPWGATITRALALEKAAAPGRIADDGNPGQDLAAPGHDQAGTSLRMYLAEPLRDVIAEAEGEHAEVTAAFVAVDVPDPGQAELDRIIETAAVTAGREGLTIIAVEPQVQGLRIMGVAGVPHVHPEESDAAIRWAFAMRDALGADAVRAGVARGATFAGRIGSATRHTYSAMGDAVNLAARLLDHCEPGTVCAEAGVLERARRVIEVEHVRQMTVRGRKTPLRACTLRQGPGRPKAPLSTTLQGRTDLLERARALRGTAVELAPTERGVGVSALLAAWPDPGRRITIDGAYGSPVPFGAITDALRATVGEDLPGWLAANTPDLLPVAELIARAGGYAHVDSPAVSDLEPRFALQITALAVARVLLSGSAALMTVDEIDSMDPESREVVQEAARMAPGSPSTVVLGLRPGAAGMAPQAVRIPVGPLSAPDARDLARRWAEEVEVPRRVADELAAVSRGVPRILREVVLAWRPTGGDLPADASALARLRVQSLPRPLERLLLYSSVAGGQFDPDVVTHVLAADPELAALAASGWAGLSDFLVDQDGRLTFTDSLVHQVCYSTLSFRRRRQLHALFGRELERRGAEPAVLAGHFHAAGDSARTWQYATAAAERARAINATATAADMYAMAVASGAGLPLCEVAEAWGATARDAGRYADAVKALRTARGCCPPARCSDLLVEEAYVEDFRGNFRRSLQVLAAAERAVEQVPAAQRPAGLAKVWMRRAGTRLRQGRLRECESAARRAVDLARRAGAMRTLARALMLLDSAMSETGRSEQATPLRTEALQIYRELGDFEGQAGVLTNVAITQYWAGEYEQSIDSYLLARDAFSRAGSLAGINVTDMNIGESLIELGRYDEAIDLFEAVAVEYARSGNPSFEITARVNLAITHLRAGNPRSAVGVVTKAREQARQLGNDHQLAAVEVKLAEALAAAGQTDQAHELLAELQADLDAGRDVLIIHRPFLDRIAQDLRD